VYEILNRFMSNKCLVSLTMRKGVVAGIGPVGHLRRPRHQSSAFRYFNNAVNTLWKLMAVTSRWLRDRWREVDLSLAPWDSTQWVEITTCKKRTSVTKIINGKNCVVKFSGFSGKKKERENGSAWLDWNSGVVIVQLDWVFTELGTSVALLVGRFGTIGQPPGWVQRAAARMGPKGKHAPCFISLGTMWVRVGPGMRARLSDGHWRVVFRLARHALTRHWIRSLSDKR